jgi:hypothetical protein
VGAGSSWGSVSYRSDASFQALIFQAVNFSICLEAEAFSNAHEQCTVHKILMGEMVTSTSNEILKLDQRLIGLPCSIR